MSAKLYFNRGLFSEALAEVQICNELHENHPWITTICIQIYMQLGEGEKAFEQIWKLYTEPPVEHDLDLVKNIYSESGIRGVIDFYIEDMVKRSEDGGRYELAIAREYGLIGEDEKALEWLEKSLEKNKSLSPEINFNIHFKNLHNNPRFIALMETMELEVQ